MASLQSHFPWTLSPLIINAPMAGFAGPSLATTVTKAGGLGIIGALFSKQELQAQLEQAAADLREDSTLKSFTVTTLPIGVGFLPFILKLEDVLPLIEEFKPSVIWLFAAKTFDDYTTWATAIRQKSPDSKIFVQVGSVSAAIHIAKTTKPDVLVLQGSDAGGHGFERGAGIISLVPETIDTLAEEGLNVPVVAAGGIVDGRGAAAALALGAQGVVMGTKFLSAKETNINPKYRAAVLEAHDGGQATIRSKVFDNLRGPNIWPELYDGRSIVVRSYKDHVEGVSIEEIRKLHNAEIEGEDKGYKSGGEGRAAIWVGTGVGLVKEVEEASEIVQNVREGAKRVLSNVAKM